MSLKYTNSPGSSISRHPNCQGCLRRKVSAPVLFPELSRAGIRRAARKPDYDRQLRFFRVYFAPACPAPRFAAEHWIRSVLQLYLTGRDRSAGSSGHIEKLRFRRLHGAAGDRSAGFPYRILYCKSRLGLQRIPWMYCVEKGKTAGRSGADSFRSF